MNVLGISGSPRRGGNTETLLAEVLHGAGSLGATVTTLRAADLDIAGCEHCDSCLTTGKCKLSDDMQLVYSALSNADRIVLASPIHFMGVTAQLKALIDRCQALWARRFKLGQPPLGDTRERRGLFVSVGGKTADNVFAGAIATVKALFAVLGVHYDGQLTLAGVDEKGAISAVPNALVQAYEAGRRLVS